jgi:hypothetical protein
MWERLARRLALASSVMSLPLRRGAGGGGQEASQARAAGEEGEGEEGEGEGSVTSMPTTNKSTLPTSRRGQHLR